MTNWSWSVCNTLENSLLKLASLARTNEVAHCPDSELYSSLVCPNDVWPLVTLVISPWRQPYFIQLEKISLSVLPFPQNKVFSFSTFTLEKRGMPRKKYTELKQDVIKLITQLNKLIEHKTRGKKNASNLPSWWSHLLKSCKVMPLLWEWMNERNEKGQSISGHHCVKF